NTAILSKSGAWAGIGFAIPVDDVNRVVTRLIQSGKVTRAGLGIVPAPDELSYKLSRRQGVTPGVLILDVYPDSAAAKAGLRPTTEEEGMVSLGDMILRVNDEPVRNAAELYSRLQRFQVGQEVTLQIRRTDPETGATRLLNVKVALQEDTR